MPTTMDPEELMVRATWMYYEDGLTHKQIAQDLQVSRITITRLLQRARREGLVQVRITRPLPLIYELEHDLQKKFALRCAIVVPTRNQVDETLDEIGIRAAEQIHRVLKPGYRLGVGWSTTVSRIIPFLKPPDRPIAFTVNELAGSFLRHTNPYSISAEIARVFKVPVETLPVPVVVQSEEARQALLKESSISTALTHAHQVNIALVGLGDTSYSCTMVQTGYLTEDEMDTVRSRGAVGDILMRYYDIQGYHVPTPIEANVISIGWEDIRQIPYIIALAAGEKKVLTIVGALRGGLVHCLITDTETAQQVLNVRFQEH